MLHVGSNRLKNSKFGVPMVSLNLKMAKIKRSWSHRSAFWNCVPGGHRLFRSIHFFSSSSFFLFAQEKGPKRTAPLKRRGAAFPRTAPATETRVCALRSLQHFSSDVDERNYAEKPPPDRTGRTRGSPDRTAVCLGLLLHERRAVPEPPLPKPDIRALISPRRIAFPFLLSVLS